MSDSTATYGGVILGAILGFLGSIGYSWWQGRKREDALRGRLKDEMSHIKKKIQAKWDSNQRVAEAYFTEFFHNHRSELDEIIDAKGWESVIRAYQEIDSLKSPSDLAQSVESYKRVLDSIDAAIKNL